ncbi:MAG: NAD(P)/FAD-dependent oxidoreductase [Candidatus Methanoperedens sp.]|nr:NAD(P)/FAD-dependent oxidoreductase [Candidatus Methanoperedens sp.]
MNKVCVVGASLSGLYAAKEAAINGADVTVIERRKDVGTVLKCGEMFTTIYGRPPEKCIVREIKNWIFDFSLVTGLEKSSPVTVNLPDSFCVMTDRATHERLLKEECLRLEVKFEFDRPYVHDAEGYDYIIIAKGASSWEKGKAFAMAYTVSCDGKVSWDYAYFKVLPSNEGYYWYFPKNNNEMNIGYGYSLTSFGGGYTLIKSGKIDYVDVLLNAEKKITFSEKIQSGGGIIPMNTDYKDIRNYYDIEKKNVLFVGDVAGMVNPMLSGGAHLAMISGQIAGYSCATKNSVESVMSNYYNGITTLIAPEMEIGIMVNNMRELMSPTEFYDFMSGALESSYLKMNDTMIHYIQRIMPKYRNIADVGNDELEELV